MREYRDKPTEFAQPTEAELKARSRRSWAIAGGLLLFVVLVFVTMVSRGEIPGAV